MSATRYDSTTVAEVQRLADAGWTQRRIRELMRDQHGHAPSFETISRWLSPKYAEASRARVRRRELETRRQRWTFRLPGQGGRHTPEYKKAFIEVLDEQNLAANSIAKVCTIVFGEPWTRYRVVKILQEAGA